MSSPTPEFVERQGLVFRFGDHIDANGRKFSLTREQFEAANPPGKKVQVGFDPIGRAHYPETAKWNAFEGKLGYAHSFSADETFLKAEFSLAPILDETIREEGLGMSGIFGVGDKKLRRIDVAKRPIIADAAFFAEDGSDEVSIVAEFATAMAPAVKAAAAAAADGPGSPLAIALAMQHVHDVCASAYPSLCTTGTARFAISEGPKKHMALIHSMSRTHGAQCSKGNARFAEEGGPPVAEKDPVENETETQVHNDNTALFAEIKSLREENAKTNQRLKAERDLRISGESAAFARDNAAVLPPPSQPLFAGLYASLAGDAADPGVVEFAYGKDQSFKGSPLDLLKSAVSKLTPHGLGVEKTTNNKVESPKKQLEGVVHFANQESDPSDPSQPTPDGQAMSPERKAFLQGLAAGTPAKSGQTFAPSANGVSKN